MCRLWTQVHGESSEPIAVISKVSHLFRLLRKSQHLRYLLLFIQILEMAGGCLYVSILDYETLRLNKLNLTYYSKRSHRIEHGRNGLGN